MCYDLAAVYVEFKHMKALSKTIQRVITQKFHLKTPFREDYALEVMAEELSTCPNFVHSHQSFLSPVTS